VTIWGLLVPETIAYAGLAGLPPQTGLYTLLASLAAYAFFGTSRHLVAAATSALAVPIASGVASRGPTSTGDYIVLASGWRDKSASTRANVISVMHSFFGWAEVEDPVAVDPSRKIRRPPKRKPDVYRPGVDELARVRTAGASPRAASNRADGGRWTSKLRSVGLSMG
jgi:hypothetical protein